MSKQLLMAPVTLESGEIRLCVQLGNETSYVTLSEAEAFCNKLNRLLKTARARGLLLAGCTAGSC